MIENPNLIKKNNLEPEKINLDSDKDIIVDKEEVIEIGKIKPEREKSPEKNQIRIEKITPEVSVIMAVHNDEKYVEEAIKSILDQIFRNFELIVIDDYSTDNSLKILEEYASRDPRIKIIRLSENIGPGGARNEGLKAAKGRYIAVQDADDISMPERLQKEYEYLVKNEDKFLVHSGAFYINENDTKIIQERIPIVNEKELLETLKIKNVIVHPTVMYKNQDYRYRPKLWFSEDYDLYLRLMSDGKKFGTTPELLVKYRVSESSRSFNKITTQRLAAIKANEYYYERLKTGNDSYDFLDEKEIINVNPLKNENEAVIRALITSYRILEDNKNLRFFCKRYFTLFGFFNKYLFVFFISYLPKNFVNFVKSKIPTKIKELFSN